jgi:hypothetical protein
MVLLTPIEERDVALDQRGGRGGPRWYRDVFL